MKFQIISDLHLEIHQEINPIYFFERDETADCLLLAGDIGYPSLPSYELFLTLIFTQYKYIILISGNHEKYNSSIEESDRKIKDIVSKFDNIFYLNNEIYEFTEQKIAILGSTLWSFIPNSLIPYIWNNVNDYKYINNFTPIHSNNLYRTNVLWLTNKLYKRKKDG